MSASARAALAGLIDYAGLFPPASLGLEAALAEYAGAASGPYAWMLRRFIVPASRLGDLARAYRAEAPLSLAVILDAGDDDRAWFDALRARLDGLGRALAADPRLRLEALEVPLPRLRSLRDSYDATIGQYAALASGAGVRQIPAYLEPVRDDRWRDALPLTAAALGRHGFGAKVRCGGATPAAIPSVEDLAAFVRASVEAGIPFKATAGLHHPVRRLDPTTGLPMHGFLNLLAATLAARVDAPPMTVEAALGEEDARAFRFDDASFAWRDLRADVAALEAAREGAFVGYGSCSFEEPVGDLQAMGVLDPVPA